MALSLGVREPAQKQISSLDLAEPTQLFEKRGLNPLPTNDGSTDLASSTIASQRDADPHMPNALRHEKVKPKVRRCDMISGTWGRQCLKTRPTP